MDKKIEVNKKALLSAAKPLASLAPKKQPNHPAITGIRVRGEGGYVFLEATDLESFATVVVPRIGGNGNAEMVLPAVRFLDMVRTGKTDTVILEVAEGCATRINGTATLIGFDPAEFPASPEPGKTLLAEFGGADLAAGFREVAFAALREKTVSPLNGILLDTVGKCVEFVACDRKQLRVRRISDGNPYQKVQLTISMKALRTLAAMADLEPESRFRLYLKKDGAPQACFRSEGVCLATTLIDADWPNYRAVIPPASGPGWRIPVERLQEGIGVIEPAIPQSDQHRAVRFTFKRSALDLYVGAKYVGEARATVPVEPIAGANNLEVTLNSGAVSRYLRTLPPTVEYVTFRLGSKNNTTLWTTGRPGDVYVLMPLKF